MSKRRILFCTSEAYPFAKTGGLGDVAHALPKALSATESVDLIMPLYQSIDRAAFSIVPLHKELHLTLGQRLFCVTLYECVYEEVRHIFVYEPLLCDREFLYGAPNAGYADNALRFGIFCHAITALLGESHYDIAHLNDWQSALVALLLKEKKSPTKTLLTIHNLAYQGIFECATLESIGIDKRHFHMDALEFYGSLNFLKGGIAFCDWLTTVSEVYAQEILTPAFGCGLEGFLEHHKGKLSGIINGLDERDFHPLHDRLITHPFANATQKAANKRAYLQAANLKGMRTPLFIFIGRFTHQKGLNLLTQILPSLAQEACNIVILGDGDASFQTPLLEVAKNHTNIRLHFEYNELHSHTLYASADFLLMPSLFEPCGLNQLIAMRYGAIPIVHSVGGLKESVQAIKDFDPKTPKGYGLLFTHPSAAAFHEAIQEALNLYKERKKFAKIRKHNMACDFSWRKSSVKYSTLYTKLLRSSE